MTTLFTVTSPEEGTVEFRTRKAAEDWAALLDRDGVTHSPVETFETVLDPADVRAIGGN